MKELVEFFVIKGKEIVGNEFDRLKIWDVENLNVWESTGRNSSDWGTYITTDWLGKRLDVLKGNIDSRKVTSLDRKMVLFFRS